MIGARQELIAATLCRAIFGIISVFAEFERAMIQERVWAGLARAKAQGKRLGRPRIDTRVDRRIREALAKCERGILKIAADLGVGSGTVQRVKVAARGRYRLACCPPSRVTISTGPVVSTASWSGRHQRGEAAITTA
jgi:hypothetical protein